MIGMGIKIGICASSGAYPYDARDEARWDEIRRLECKVERAWAVASRLWEIAGNARTFEASDRAAQRAERAEAIAHRASTDAEFLGA